MTRVINIKCEVEDDEDDFMNLNMERFCDIPEGNYFTPDVCSSASNTLPSVNTLFDIQSQTDENGKIDIIQLTRSPKQELFCNFIEDSTGGEKANLYFNNQYINNYEEIQLESYGDEDSLVPDQITTAQAENPNKELNIEEALECRWQDCWWLFKCQKDLVRHIEHEHVEPKRGDEFPCLWQHCPRRSRPFNARYKLLIHMRVHSGEKPNKCQYAGCKKAFSRLENLKIHQRSHTGERPYSCQYATCNKAFSNSSDRAKHQRTHFDTKPYGCQVSGCNKRYTDPSSLRKHLKNHKGHQVTPKTKKLIASEPKVSAAELQSRCITVRIFNRDEEELLDRTSVQNTECKEEVQQNHIIDYGTNFSPIVAYTSSTSRTDGFDSRQCDNNDSQILTDYGDDLAECSLDSDTEREFLDLEKLELTSLFPLNEEDLLNSLT